MLRFFAMKIEFESEKHDVKVRQEILLFLWESRAPRPGEGPRTETWLSFAAE